MPVLLQAWPGNDSQNHAHPEIVAHSKWNLTNRLGITEMRSASLGDVGANPTVGMIGSLLLLSRSYHRYHLHSPEVWLSLLLCAFLCSHTHTLCFALLWTGACMCIPFCLTNHTHLALCFVRYACCVREMIGLLRACRLRSLSFAIRSILITCHLIAVCEDNISNMSTTFCQFTKKRRWENNYSH